MQAALGQDSKTLAEFRKLRYHIGFSSGAPGEEARNVLYFAKQVDNAAGLIDAAIYELQLQDGQDEADGTATGLTSGIQREWWIRTLPISAWR